MRWDDALFGYAIGDPDGDLALDDRDSAPFVPEVVVDRPGVRLGRRPPAARRPGTDTVIYEATSRA